MHDSVKVAIFSIDPPGLTTFHTFDPESFAVISLVNDALVLIDADGNVQPGLATSWHRTSPVELELTLRRGVKFHNGEPFDADDVLATFHAHRFPSDSAGAAGILAPIVHVSKVDAFTVRITTAFPDAMLVRRLWFSSIYPKGVLEAHGRDGLANHPIGTGAYRFVSYERGREVVLERNHEHWQNAAVIERLRLPILRQKEWIDRLERGELDAALNIDSHDRVRAERLPGITAISRPAATSQWFLLTQRGPLADLRVRQALNHAINRKLMVDVTAHGYGQPQRSIGTEGQQGYTECEPYRYSPELARRLLASAGYPSGFRLQGIVSETSTAVYFMVKEFLSRIGVELAAEIVPRTEWISRLAGAKASGQTLDVDFALALIDNPVLHVLFHHFLFLFSQGPFGIVKTDDFDSLFLGAVTTVDESSSDALAKLEHYARDQALVLFTIQEQVHAAFRGDFTATLPRSGQFQASMLVTLRAHGTRTPARSLPSPALRQTDSATLLDGTSYTGAFFLKPGVTFKEPVLERVWSNIITSEKRWRLEGEPMVRELVSQAEAKVNLSNVLCSTERIAIVGYSAEGRLLFENRGHQLMFGASQRTLLDFIAPRWDEIRAQVNKDGAFVGSVHLPINAQTDHLYLSVTRAVDDEGQEMGHTFVLSDFSGEEERIRNQAIRTILDNVPYGLFMCDRGGRVLHGYSDACTKFFVTTSAGIEGRSLSQLLGMEPREADHFLAGYTQLFDDLLPEEVSLDNLPKRVRVGTRTFSLSAAVVRDEAGVVASVLFTLLDISSLIEAERENEQLRGAIQVMRYRARFEEFALDLHRKIQTTIAHADAPDFEELARRLLHTAKGVLGQFSLYGLAREIHHIEDSPRIATAQLAQVAASLHDLLAENFALWGIRLERAEPTFSVGESALAEIEALLADGASDDKRRLALARVRGLRASKVADLLGPLEENCRLHAERVGKRVKLELAGAELRCPPTISEVFAVLPHLIRNSLDHGIETPDERGNKPEVATIRFGISDNDNGLRITISDDGRGIAADSVAQRALELGLVGHEELAQMSEAERLNLIFLTGLSTAKEVSATAGRGVGMGAVKATVEALGGRLTLATQQGRGTRFDIHFPRPTG
jgi:peptide/nickel transport system substrate-binding protein